MTFRQLDKHANNDTTVATVAPEFCHDSCCSNNMYIKPSLPDNVILRNVEQEARTNGTSKRNCIGRRLYEGKPEKYYVSILRLNCIERKNAN